MNKKFTLVELLVVVAMLAILLSILLPSLTKARQRSIAALCLSNTSQISMATHAYLNDNTKILPVIDLRNNDVSTTWPVPVDKYFSGSVNAENDGHAGNDFNSINKGNKPSPAWYCPSAIPMTESHPWWTGDTYWGADDEVQRVNYAIWEDMPGRHIGKIDDLGEMMWSVDGAKESRPAIANNHSDAIAREKWIYDRVRGYASMSPGSRHGSTSWKTISAFRHMSRTENSMSFMDGHAKFNRKFSGGFDSDAVQATNEYRSTYQQ